MKCLLTKDPNNVNTCPTLPSNSSISDVVFAENEVFDKIGKFKTNSAPGPDCISPRVLKDYASVLSYPLSIVYTKIHVVWHCSFLYEKNSIVEICAL